jgi:hypothetical protein
MIHARGIGVLEAEQTEDGKKVRREWMIAIAEDAHGYADLMSLKAILMTNCSTSWSGFTCLTIKRAAGSSDGCRLGDQSVPAT